MIVKKVLCLLLSIILLITLTPLSYAVAKQLPFSDDPKSIQTASNSVIMLSCYDKDGRLYSTGSAFAAFEDGVFITNCHVIEKEVYEIKAHIETGLEFTISSVVAYDKDRDIAILRTEAKTGLKPLVLGSSEALERGDKVIAIGSPLGLINTLSVGLYSGTIKDEQLYLQFSASISPGSSGGALFNNNGEVVGITAASYTEGQNLNLAIPIECAIELWENRTTEKELSVSEFYDEWDHINFYSVSYIVSHKADFRKDITILTEGYVFFDPSSSNMYYLVDNTSDYYALQDALSELNSLGEPNTLDLTMAKYGGNPNHLDEKEIKELEEKVERQENAKKNYNNILKTTALTVMTDEHSVSQGDFIRIQADIWITTLKNVSLIN